MLQGDGRTRPEHFDPQLLAIFESEQGLFRRVFESLQDDRPE
jgi:putative two-component system response regulator